MFPHVVVVTVSALLLTTCTRFWHIRWLCRHGWPIFYLQKIKLKLLNLNTFRTFHVGVYSRWLGAWTWQWLCNSEGKLWRPLTDFKGTWAEIKGLNVFTYPIATFVSYGLPKDKIQCSYSLNWLHEHTNFKLCSEYPRENKTVLTISQRT